MVLVMYTRPGGLFDPIEVGTASNKCNAGQPRHAAKISVQCTVFVQLLHRRRSHGCATVHVIVVA
jgi:hypothetical protein